MNKRSFWSWPAGWRKALPGGVVFGLIIVVVGIVGGGVRSGDLCELAFCFPFLVVSYTVFAARLRSNRDQDDIPKP